MNSTYIPESGWLYWDPLMQYPHYSNYPANMGDPAGCGKSTFLSNTLL